MSAALSEVLECLLKSVVSATLNLGVFVLNMTKYHLLRSLRSSVWVINLPQSHHLRMDKTLAKNLSQMFLLSQSCLMSLLSLVLRLTPVTLMMILATNVFVVLGKLPSVDRLMHIILPLLALSNRILDLLHHWVSLIVC